jgi:hypothetical protein
MSPDLAGERQNDGVTARRAPLRLIALLATLALVLGACGSGSDDDEPSAEETPTSTPSVELPTGNVEVPEGVELTEAGTTLDFGQPAVVAYEPNTERSSVLSMSVNSVQTGQIQDFAAYQLDARTKRSRPYYVRVTARNVGKGDLSRAAVPLLAVDTRDTLIQPSSFNNSFRKCPSTPLPPGFGPGKAANLCLVYLVPNRGRLTEMSFRPLQAFEPILWKGPIKPVVLKKKPGKKKNG